MKIFRNPRDDWLTSLHSDLRVDHIITKPWRALQRTKVFLFLLTTGTDPSLHASIFILSSHYFLILPSHQCIPTPATSLLGSCQHL